MTTRGQVAREIAVLEAQFAALQQTTDAAAAEQERYWALFERLLHTGMPRPYAAAVYAELEAGTPSERWSPLLRRCHAIVRWHSLVGANPCPWPLLVTEQDATVLAGESADAVDWGSAPSCVACGHVEPCWKSTGRGSVAEPCAWTSEGVRCSACGSASQWPADWLNCWWSDREGRAWRWDPTTGTVARCCPEQW